MNTQKAPILILNGSQQPYLSVGRHYGGIKAFGRQYYYLHDVDAFIRSDYAAKLARHRKVGKTWEEFIDYVKAIDDK